MLISKRNSSVSGAFLGETAQIDRILYPVRKLNGLACANSRLTALAHAINPPQRWIKSAISQEEERLLVSSSADKA
jgi:hypothetical protein